MTLPLLVSVPHAGLRVPQEVGPYCVLSPEEIERDGDAGAGEVYDLGSEVQSFVTTDIARAIVDLNRPEDDRRADGVVKTHTCWNVPVYRSPLPEGLVETLLERYHRPYHRRLSGLAGGAVLCGVDGHTMAAFGPPVGPDPGRERPAVCLSHAGHTCPEPWFRRLADGFRESFSPFTVRTNDPFRGGYTIRAHAKEMPWVQVELSRAPFLPHREKRDRVLRALRYFCEGIHG